MNKQQLLVVTAGFTLMLGLFFFGRTKPHAKHLDQSGPGGERPDTEAILNEAKGKLTPGQARRIAALEQAVVRGDLKHQRIAVYNELANFWRDSARVFEPYAYYLGEKAKLENSENSLTFAAHLFLQELRGSGDPGAKAWMADQAKDLFSRALDLNPQNDSSRVGLGSCYFFGAGGSASPMEGIQKIREVVERDSSNAFAQFMLGYGGMISGQYDKASERLLKAVRLAPGNTEAIFLLAEAYEKNGEKEKAIEWYKEARKKVNHPELLSAIDEKINSLK